MWGWQPNDIFMVWTISGEVRNVWLAGISMLGFLQLKHLLGAGRHHTVLALACLSCDRKLVFSFTIAAGGNPESLWQQGVVLGSMPMPFWHKHRHMCITCERCVYKVCSGISGCALAPSAGMYKQKCMKRKTLSRITLARLDSGHLR